MSDSEITKTLPPILLGFGGLIPILIIYGQETVSKADRALIGTIFVLVTWIAYLLTGFLWGIWIYDFFLVLGLLFLATSLLIICVIYRTLSRRPETSSPGAAFVFLGAIAILAFASAVYVQPSGHDVVHLTATMKSEIQGVQGLFRDEDHLRDLLFITRFGSTSVVLSKDQFKDLETLTLAYRDGTKSSAISALNAVPMQGPYLGQHYILNMQGTN
jgi:hypothetical protein